MGMVVFSEMNLFVTIFILDPPKLKDSKLMLSNMNFPLDVGMYDYSN